MKELDSDDVRLLVEERHAERVIVQFVLKKFLSPDGFGSYTKSQINLVKEVLEEIPYEVVWNTSVVRPIAPRD